MRSAPAPGHMGHALAPGVDNLRTALGGNVITCIYSVQQSTQYLAAVDEFVYCYLQELNTE